MPGFKEVSNFDDIRDYSNWNNSAKFNSAGKIVNKDGRQFCIIGKKQRDLGYLEWAWNLLQKSEETIRLGICIDRFINPSRCSYFPSRCSEETKGEELLKFYASKGIKNGGELLEVNDEDIMFENESSDNRYVLKALSLFIVNEINGQITEREGKGYSVSKRREVCLDINLGKKCPFFRVHRTLLDSSKDSNSFLSDQEYYDATFIGSAINRLKEKGYIYNLLKIDGNGWVIQV